MQTSNEFISGYTWSEPGTEKDSFDEETHCRGRELPPPPDNEAIWLGLPSDELRERIATRIAAGIEVGRLKNEAVRYTVKQEGLGVLRRAKARAEIVAREKRKERELRAEILDTARRRVR